MGKIPNACDCVVARLPERLKLSTIFASTLEVTPFDNGYSKTMLKIAIFWNFDPSTAQ